ncbi:MAG: hypothetical protein KDE47_00780 [Caldilineaceae bacterium]|nr:hypothetical protein [Caldilineaceae bacterium]
MMNASEKAALMGRRVTVTKEFVRQYIGARRVYKSRAIIPTEGWVVGFRTIWNGYMTCDMGEYGQRDSNDYFVHQQAVQCVMVAFSPYQNARKIPLDGITWAQEMTDGK